MKFFKRAESKHRAEPHEHEWVYGPRTLAGWGIVKCACGESDLY